MKGYSQSAAIVALFMASFIFSSCIKEREYIEQHSSDIGKFCRIDSMAINVGLGFQNYKFSYNEKGDPLEIRLQINPGGFGEDLHFRYDKKGRLSDVLQTDPGQSFVYVWSRYTYRSPRLIVDSFFEYEDFLSDVNPNSSSFYGLDSIQLDEEGRVAGPGVTYDYHGNLVVPGFKYDDKINIYQTSRVWQLLYRDYSRNNLTAGGGMTGLPVDPASYNAFGLPTKILGPFHEIFGVSPFREIDVSYSCDVPSSQPD